MSEEKIIIKFSTFEESEHPREQSGKFTDKGKTQKVIERGEEKIADPEGETETPPDVGGGFAQKFVDKIYRIANVFWDQKKFDRTAREQEEAYKKGKIYAPRSEEFLRQQKAEGKYAPAQKVYSQSTIKIKFGTEFDESKVNRDAEGQFSDKDGGGKLEKDKEIEITDEFIDDLRKNRSKIYDLKGKELKAVTKKMSLATRNQTKAEVHDHIKSHFEHQDFMTEKNPEVKVEPTETKQEPKVKIEETAPKTEKSAYELIKEYREKKEKREKKKEEFASTIKIRFGTEFDESKVNRDDEGQFSDKDGGGKVSKIKVENEDEFIKEGESHSERLGKLSKKQLLTYVEKSKAAGGVRLYKTMSKKAIIKNLNFGESIDADDDDYEKWSEYYNISKEILGSEEKKDKFASTIKIKFESDRIWIPEHTRRGKQVKGHWREKRGREGSGQPADTQKIEKEPQKTEISQPPAKIPEPKVEKPAIAPKNAQEMVDNIKARIEAKKGIETKKAAVEVAEKELTTQENEIISEFKGRADSLKKIEQETWGNIQKMRKEGRDTTQIEKFAKGRLKKTIQFLEKYVEQIKTGGFDLPEQNYVYSSVKVAAEIMQKNAEFKSKMQKTG